MKKDKITILLGIIFVFSLSSSEAVEISGVVTDSKTGAPIFFANVFLSNTTVGTTTNEKGVYIIKKAPPGVFDLVFRHIGYELYSEKIELRLTTKIKVDVQLSPKVHTGEEISITALSPKEWRKRLKEFTKVFLGESDNTEQCRIINPLVLNFEFSNNIKSAVSDSVIIVHNNALGYIIHNYIDYFSWTKKLVSHNVYSQFSEMKPESEKQRIWWQKRRRKSYNGSLKHFIRSFCKRELKKDGFKIYNGPKRILLRGGGDRFKPDSLYNILANHNLNGDKELGVYIHPQLGEVQIPEKWITFKRLYFEDWLRVEYKKTIPAKVSLFTLNRNIAYVDTLGNILNPIRIKEEGYWATKRISDRLPLDYYTN